MSNDPDILKRELSELGFADTDAAARHIADWRSGKARSLRSPAAQQAFEAMLPGLVQALAAGADPNHALNRLSDIVERLSSGVNLFRLLEARPPLARLLAKILAHAPALADQSRAVRNCSKGCSTRRASPCRRRLPSSPDCSSDAMRGQPYDVALDRARRLVNERRFALGVQLIDRRRDPLEVAARLCPGRRRNAGRAGRGRGCRI